MAESYVTSTALMTCTFGIATCPLVVNPSRTDLTSGLQKANITDFQPITNIASFGMCSSPANPAVIAATAAAFGVPTPAPCIPAIVTPWAPGKPDILVQGMPALTNTCRNTCLWGGQISFTNDGQVPTPPPIITPLIGDPKLEPTEDRADLTDTEIGQMSASDQQQYSSDRANAENAGRKDAQMSEAWGKTSAEYAKNGEPKKAEFAQKKSDDAKATSVDKRNVAVGNVNQSYRQKIADGKKEAE